MQQRFNSFYMALAILAMCITPACSPKIPIVNERKIQANTPDIQLTEIERIRKEEIEGILSSVDVITAYSLYHLVMKSDETFLGKKVMGHDVVTGEEARKIKDQYHLYNHTMHNPPGRIVITCFESPSFYQGIRIKKENDMYDFLICVNCKKIEVFKNETKIWEGNAKADPDVQNAYFRSRNIPVDDYYLKRN